MSILKTRLNALGLALALAAGLAATSFNASADKVSEPGMTWDCGFSPEGTSLETVTRAIEAVTGSNATILVAAYEFTSRPIAEALIAAEKRGVTVAVVADTTENEKQYSKVHDLIAAGIPVRFDNTLAMLHSKYIVLNKTAVETGSFNYTAAAASNKHAENACVFRHAPKMADRFVRDWKALWNEATPVR
jgi:phosphatidylserine/phosphatidylglycerophosphate/cardiolipin synthase-like enzyme